MLQVKARNSDDDAQASMTLSQVREDESKYFGGHLTLRGCELAGTPALARRLNEIQSERLIKSDIVSNLREKVRQQVNIFVHSAAYFAIWENLQI